MSNNAHDLSKRLLNALDNSYNVVDMHTVNEIISILEKINITKELLETTRLGKHVNELRRKTKDPTLARRAKVLVKRWRDLVIPNAPTAAPALNTVTNRSSAEQQSSRRLGGTPLTSPALIRHVVSPAVQSPLVPTRPAWGGYESDSQDVILVDDDPEPVVLSPDPAPMPVPITIPTATPVTPTKRPTSPEAPSDEKKAKRDKKPKKKRGRGRAGSGSEAAAEWSGRNGSSAPVPPALPPTTPAAHRPGRKNGRRKSIDAYSALVNKMPPAGGKKVKTTVELLEEIQSRGTKPVPSPGSPASPDVMFIEPEPSPVNLDSPLRNGDVATKEPSPPPPPSPLPPLEDPRPYHECTCNEEFADEDCPAATNYQTVPLHVKALHNAYLPGINGTRAPTHPHQFAVREPHDVTHPELFSSVVPLYKYSDYADDYCVKNMSRVPICEHLKWTQFAPNPPSPPPKPAPPTPRPYPIEDTPTEERKEETADVEMDDLEEEISSYVCPKIEAEMVSLPVLEPSERLKPPILDNEDENIDKSDSVTQEVKSVSDVQKSDFLSDEKDHRTVERTKVDLDGRTLYNLCESARSSIPYDYSQTSSTPVVTLPLDEGEAEVMLEGALETAQAETDIDEFGRPARSKTFTEWHECARLGDLIALPYVVID